MPKCRIGWANNIARWMGVWGFSLVMALSADAMPPAGAEFQINTYTANHQFDPTVSAASDGSFVVVWRSSGSFGTDTSGDSIQGQRYASDGSALGAEFQVNTYTTDHQDRANVSVAADGDFVVVWHSDGSSGTDTSLDGILGQRFASDGSTQGAEFQVNTYTTGDQQRPAVATAFDGGFVVAWESTGSSGTDTSSISIQGQRYASDGSPLGAQFQVNTFTPSEQRFPSVATAANGDFVVAWNSEGSSGSDTSTLSVQGQRFASDGSPQGAQFQINTYTTSFQFGPSVAADTDGDFVVVWISNGSSGADSSARSVQGQRYASSGSAQGAQFEINTYTTGNQFDAMVSMDPDGHFVVAWDSYSTPGTDTSSTGIQGQRFSSDGAMLDGQFQVNTYTTDLQAYPYVAVAPDGDFVVAWVSYGSSGSDTSFASVQGQRYGIPTPEPPLVPAMASAARAALAMALLLLGTAYALRRRA